MIFTALLSIYENEVKDLIEKLDEIQDKEYASNLYKSLSEDAKQAHSALKGDQLSDLESIKKHNGLLQSIENEIERLDKKIEDLKAGQINIIESAVASSGEIKYTPGLLGAIFSACFGFWAFLEWAFDRDYGRSLGLALLPFIFAAVNGARREKNLDGEIRGKADPLGDEKDKCVKSKASLVEKRRMILEHASFRQLLAKHDLQEAEVSCL